MSTSFPCPNPTCGQVFSPDAIKGAASLVCPRCGTTYQFRSSTPPAPAAPARSATAAPRAPATPAKPAAPPRPAAKGPPPLPAKRPAGPPPNAVRTKPAAPPAPPQAPLAAPAPPVAMPVLSGSVAGQPAPGSLQFESGPALVAPPTKRRSPPRERGSGKIWMIIVSVLLGGTALAGLVWAALWMLQHINTDDPDMPVVQDTENGNCKYLTPAGAWKSNRDAVSKLNVNFALSRRQPSNSFGLFYQDFKQRLPSEAEMQDIALRKLRGFFQPMEWERKPKSEARLGGLPVAMQIEFEGVDVNEHVPMSGEVWVMASRGYGYWFFTWCPVEQKDAVAGEWDKLRAGFSLLKNREGWVETPRESDTASVPELPYEIRFVKELWRVQSPEKWDPNARVVLLGNDPNEPKQHVGKAANFRIIVLEKAPGLKEAADAARKYLLERQKEEYSETVIEPLKHKDGKEFSSLANIGSERGHLSKLLVRNSESRERYVILGVVQASENTLMLMCECDYNRKDFWDVEFTPLLSAFRHKR